MYLDYIKERYTAADFAPHSMEQIAEHFEDIQRLSGAQILKTKAGFVTYKISGDSVVIFDMYVKPEFRGKSEAWKLHDVLVEAARRLGKTVAITFSSLDGKNHEAGLEAIKAAEFVPTNYKIGNGTSVFIKGI